MAARRAHNPKVVGSNPTPATKNEVSNLLDASFLFSDYLRNLFQSVSAVIITIGARSQKSW